ncbi:hypothetical protein HanIR_Chr15g0767041 [Helianthus annuus]|nr:hypothetical protein HanIR_Chr15g0767041 [Helianthus annuus]
MKARVQKPKRRYHHIRARAAESSNEQSKCQCNNYGIRSDSASSQGTHCSVLRCDWLGTQNILALRLFLCLSLRLDIHILIC